MILHLFLMSMVLVHTYDENMAGILEQIKTNVEFTIVVMFGSFALAMTSLAWGLILKPGYQPKISIIQSGNVIQKICSEMDSPSEDDVTQLDELCLVCLTEKFLHMEHCKKCNRCVRHFHLHCDFFNKCFGDANVRPYIFFHFISIKLCFVYIYHIGRFYFALTTSEFLMG